MAVTLTQAELSAAIRLGDSTEEVAEATSACLPITIEAISQAPGRGLRSRARGHCQ